jgi:hypothetical protein
MEFLFHEKYLWKIISRKLSPLKIEFEEIFLKGGIHEHHMFMKKNKLACGTILNVIDHLLQKKLRTTFVQHLKDDMLAIDCNFNKSFIIIR